MGPCTSSALKPDASAACLISHRRRPSALPSCPLFIPTSAVMSILPLATAPWMAQARHHLCVLLLGLRSTRLSLFPPIMRRQRKVASYLRHSKAHATTEAPLLLLSHVNALN